MAAGVQACSHCTPQPGLCERPPALITHSQSLIHTLTHSLTHSFIHTLIHSFTYSFTNSHTHSLTHSLTDSLTMPHPHTPVLCGVFFLPDTRVNRGHKEGKALGRKARCPEGTQDRPKAPVSSTGPLSQACLGIREPACCSTPGRASWPAPCGGGASSCGSCCEWPPGLKSSPSAQHPDGPGAHTPTTGVGGHHQRASSGRVHHGQDHQASFWAGSLGIAPAPQGRHRPTWDELAWGCSPPPGAQPASQAALVRRRGVVLTPGMPPLSPSAARVGPAQQPWQQEGWWWPPGTGAPGSASQKPAQPRFRAGGPAR